MQKWSTKNPLSGGIWRHVCPEFHLTDPIWHSYSHIGKVNAISVKTTSEEGDSSCYRCKLEGCTWRSKDNISSFEQETTLAVGMPLTNTSDSSKIAPFSLYSALLLTRAHRALDKMNALYRKQGAILLRQNVSKIKPWNSTGPWLMNTSIRCNPETSAAADANAARQSGR
jgi:hypothetical protein